MHRLIAGATSKDIVDHINHNTLDNRRENLRLVCKSKNGQNRRESTSASGYIGVVRQNSRDVTWQAKIMHKGKRYSLGTYADAREAAKAYDRKAIELFGAEARTNFGGAL
jgi:hypothetical protein